MRALISDDIMRECTLWFCLHHPEKSGIRQDISMEKAAVESITAAFSHIRSVSSVHTRRLFSSSSMLHIPM